MVLYFPLKVAVRRLGGNTEAALKLGVPTTTLNHWTHPDKRVRTGWEQLSLLSDLSGVAMASFLRYYAALDRYREAEKNRPR